MSLKDTKNPLVLGIFLGVLGALAALIMGGMADFTRKPIQLNQKKKTADALRNVMAAFENSPGEDTITVVSTDPEKLPVTFYRGRDKAGKVVGVAGETVTPKGYAGKIKVMVGLNLDGKIRTVIVTEQHETPGLGTVVCGRKEVVTIGNLIKGKASSAGLPPNPILDQFSGHAAVAGDSWNMPWKVSKDGGNASFITGATISSRAVTDAAFRIAKTYADKKAEITGLVPAGNAKK